MSGVGQGIRYALRSWARTPAVTAAAVLTLGLAIGANTALFSLVDNLLFKTLPVRDPEQLVMVKGGPARLASEFFTYAIWDQFNQRQQELPSFEGMFAWSPSKFNLAVSGEVDDVEGLWVTGKFFDTLGVSPALGRVLMPTDDQPDGGPSGPAAVISYQFWQRRFGASADVIGRTLYVQRVPYTIVGVTPRNFFGPVVGSTFDIVLPVQTEPLIPGRQNSFLTNPRSVMFNVMGRIKPRVSLDAVTTDLRAIQPHIRDAVRPADSSEPYLQEPFTVVPAASGVEFPAPASLRGRYKLPLLILLAAAGTLLLIGCANIANLLLARAAARTHELNLRLALGASQWRLAREAFIETFLLVVAGTLVGLVVGRWSGPFLVEHLGPSVIGRAHLELSPDWRMLTFTAVVMTVTTLLCGMSAAFRTSELRPIDTMKARSSGLDLSTNRYTDILVISQIALSFVLVVIAGLFTGTFARLMTADLGFDRSGVLLIGVDPDNVDIERTARIALFEQVHEAALSVPGVAGAAISSLTPFGGRRFGVGFQVPGRTGDANGNGYFISAGWFLTYRMALLAGRDFNAQDRAGAPRTVIVNQAFARGFLDGVNPVGHTIDYVDRKRRVQYEIVGLVSDSAYNSIKERESAPLTFYLPIAQYDTTSFPGPGEVTVTVRPASDSGALLARNVTAAVMKVNPHLSLTVRTLSDQVAMSVSQERLLAMLAGFFGVLGLLLAAVGLYGMTSYAVSLRRAEMGIRIALGGEPRRLIWMVMQRVGVLIFVGVGIGILLSWWATRLIAVSLLYGLQPRDPLTLLGAIVVLTMVGVLAGWIPARRAARVDPLVALRYE